ncbi:phenylalanine--tRNA ligase beta subunit [Paenibacillus sp. J31TS4]|uniref:phenylalanine--tRNA ligase subunit beta n=1 Tax=Paenibacillus sp. J31TS4 TaxID=2807195 RepID=UPI001B26A7E4|nr:phenylalanine--tRNA ligase subunit beta [Paenibacillus sp. J31TS4]GIP38804.1 phenylalanine--tRNA ligase beta subunit [Paenibacillus sp. J31TS4]
MKVSYQWLSDYVDLSGYTAEELAEKLTRSGVEVDIVEKRNKGVTNVVVGHVVAKEKHPDADKLNVCQVDAGQGETLQIVCGAKNVDAGQKVPVALVGASLPDGLKIKRAKLRGVESQGMICSAKELGLNDRLLPKEIQEGILVLPETTQVGESVLDVLGIDDSVLELDLTPNRSDCLSMIGVAYEIAAILGREVKLPDEREGLVETAAPASSKVSVTVSSPELCDRYAARYLEGVQIGPSPLWMQNRLMAAGVRPINNIVDITNYVMLEYGQPLHAFDADTLDGGRIDVRTAREGEHLVTLDDADRALEPHMLLITDGTKAVGIAGVMGGANSEVTAGTSRIVLESAKFSGPSVRRTSRQLGLRSEASLRFEKEVNPEAVLPALNRAASLMCRYAGGEAASGIVDVETRRHEPVQISLTLERINGYLGTDLTASEVLEIVKRLHLDVEQGADDALLVRVPARRGDMTRDVDLMEEVARLYGYDNIPTTLMSGVTTPGSLTREQQVRRAVRQLLTQSGLHEVISYSFVPEAQRERFRGRYADARPIRLAMPMSEERSTLRTSLVPNLLEIAEYNRNRSIDDVAVFEIGKVFLTQEKELGSLPQERLLLSILWTGSRQGAHWSGKPAKADFYDLKGVVEKLTSYLGVPAEYRSAQPEGYHPGRTAEVVVRTEEGEAVLGTIGQLHPDLQRTHDLEETYLAELELDTLCGLADFSVQYAPLPRYPAMTRDLALVVDSGVAVGSMEQTARETAGSLLESIEVFDVYTGERLGEGKKSVALSLVYRHPERTLTDEEVTELNGKVVAALEQSFEAELRK